MRGSHRWEGNNSGPVARKCPALISHGGVATAPTSLLGSRRRAVMHRAGAAEMHYEDVPHCLRNVARSKGGIAGLPFPVTAKQAPPIYQPQQGAITVRPINTSRGTSGAISWFFGICFVLLSLITAWVTHWIVTIKYLVSGGEATVGYVALLILGCVVPPIGIIHGIGIWLGAW